jgi:putative FmdB family regulatory protein
MPIYEYRCRQCQHGFEAIVLSREEKVSCPQCQNGAVEKQLSVFSAPALQSEKGAAGGGCGCTPQSCGCR